MLIVPLCLQWAVYPHEMLLLHPMLLLTSELLGFWSQAVSGKPLKLSPHPLPSLIGLAVGQHYRDPITRECGKTLFL